MVQSEHTAGSFEAFLKEIETYLSKEQIALNLFQGGNSILVVESFWQDFVKGYSRFLSQLVSGAALVSKEKAERKLVSGLTSPVCSYIFKGKQPVPVYVIALPNDVAHHYAIKQYHGEPLQTVNYIHPRDPLLAQLETLRMEEGHFRVSFASQGRDFCFGQPVLIDFREYLSFFPKLVEQFPQAPYSLRYTLLAFVELLKGSKRVTAKQPCLVPLAFDQKQHDLWKIGKVFFYVKRLSATIENFFSPFGKSGAEFFDNELRQLAARPRAREKQQFRVLKSAKVEIPTFHKPAFVTALTLRDYFGRVGRVREGKQLGRFFTVLQCLASLAKHLSRAIPVPDHRQSAELRSKVRSGELVLKDGPWTFIIASPSAQVRMIAHVDVSKGSRTV